MTDIDNLINNRQQDAERLFAASTFTAPDRALEYCGWIAPAVFHDDAIRRYWELFLDTRDAIGSAMKAGIAIDITGWMKAEMFEWYPYDPRPFAEAVLRENYFRSLSYQLSPLARALAGGDIQEVTRITEAIKVAAPGRADSPPTSTDVGIDFASSLDDDADVVYAHIPKIDMALGGFWRQAETVICARPAVGKTALAWQIARNVAASGKKALFISLEMSQRKLWARAVCGALRIPYRDVLAKRIDPGQRQSIIDKNGELMDMFADRLFVNDKPTQTTADIWQQVCQLRPDLVVVDHIRLLSDKVYGEKEVKRLGAITWALKQIAKEFNCAVVPLAQLNRGLESREDKHPTLSDLRDSGEIEENADVVIGLHRDRTALEQVMAKTRADVEVLKFRDGPASILIKLEFDGLAQWFNE